MYRSPLPALPLVAVACIAAAPAAVAQPGSGAAYLGRWNYDFPDHSTMLDYATENIPGAPDAPQIGDIIFTSSATGRVTGRTDVGCTWEFAPTADGLTLDPPNQTCHNPTFGYTYTTTAWTVRVHGDKETESITAVSHHQDTDYTFTLQHGARTRVPEDDPDSAEAFEGSWHDPQQPGNVTLTRNYGNRLLARTDDGCTWTLVARGDTAKLDPPVQTCTAGDSAVTLTFWTIADSGDHQFSTMVGTDANGGPIRINSELTRQ
ncbi:hypothetical protein [Nocardia stercoris]|uniref:Uncharacterized protein n=1 Tax=Nocardia stercoris TaxID=2483361 RepID=A0A3M2KWQ2_9NOCA|nr:hypothetical protein [Nocardia stercoris]RMI28683.1 hypothetical protein EBN03_28985 [Nocardia stercoris]